MAVLEGESLFNDASSITLFEVQSSACLSPDTINSELCSLLWSAASTKCIGQCHAWAACHGFCAVFGGATVTGDVALMPRQPSPCCLCMQVFLSLVVRLESGKSDMSFGATALDLLNRIVVLSVGVSRPSDLLHEIVARHVICHDCAQVLSNIPG